MHVLVLYGGVSAEAGVSVASAVDVCMSLSRLGCHVTPIRLMADGSWSERVPQAVETEVSPQLPSGASTPRSSDIFDGLRRYLDSRSPDLVFPIIHGDYGEDGRLGAIASGMEVRMAGSDPASSAICYDKRLFKAAMADLGISVVHSVVRHGDTELHEAAVPCVVKPARSGSSLGVSLVREESQLAAAIENAERFDRSVVVERYMEAVEIEIGVVGEANEPLVGEPVEIAYFGDIYDFRAKYESGRDARHVPARIPTQWIRRVIRVAGDIWSGLHLSGFVRIDFFLDPSTGELFANEANTIPYMTKESSFSTSLTYGRFPDYDELIGAIVGSAVDRAH